MLGWQRSSGGLSKAPCPHTNVRQIDSRRKKEMFAIGIFPLLSAGQSRSRELILVRISSKYLGYQVAPINRDFSGTAERLRLMVC